MSDDSDNRDVQTSRASFVSLVVWGVLLAALILVGLVLTGIIAEPETVIESIRKALFGG